MPDTAIERSPPVHRDLWQTVPQDMRPEAADRIGYLRSYGIDARQAFDTALTSMHADREAAEGRVRSIRTWMLAYRIRSVVEAVRQPDGRDDPRVTALVSAVHDEGLARLAGRTTPMQPSDLEAIAVWYAAVLRAEADAERLDDVVPQSILKSTWAQVDVDLRADTLERSGFLILRGLSPEKAIVEAVTQHVAELNEMQLRGFDVLTSRLFGEVASVFPHPRRRPTGIYPRRILKLVERVHENAMARMVAGNAFVEEEPDWSHAGERSAGTVETITRRYCDRIRTSLIAQEMEEAADDTGR